MRLEDLTEAFNSLMAIASQKYGVAFDQNSCSTSLRELEGSFIRIGFTGEGTIIGFHNPSVLDFLENYISKSDELLRDIYKSIVFYEQFIGLCSMHKGKKELEHLLAFIGNDTTLLRTSLARTISRRLDNYFIFSTKDGHVNAFITSSTRIEANISHAIRTINQLGGDFARVASNDLLRIILQICDDTPVDLKSLIEIYNASTFADADNEFLDDLFNTVSSILRSSVESNPNSETLELFCDMYQSCTDKFPSDLLESTVTALSERSSEIFDPEISSASELSELDEIKSRVIRTADVLGVDMTEVVSRIDEEIETIQREAPEDPDDERISNSSESVELSDDDIFDMFSQLSKR